MASPEAGVNLSAQPSDRRCRAEVCGEFVHHPLIVRALAEKLMARTWLRDVDECTAKSVAHCNPFQHFQIYIQPGPPFARAGVHDRQARLGTRRFDTSRPSVFSTDDVEKNYGSAEEWR